LKFDPNIGLHNLPIERAALDGNIHIMKSLLESGAKITQKTLQYAAYQSQYEAIDIILSTKNTSIFIESVLSNSGITDKIKEYLKKAK